MNDIINLWASKEPILLDGAWGTQLQERGLQIGECSEACNLSHPEWVEEVARAYVEAGSDIILTNSFCGNRIMLERHDLDDRTGDINRIAAEISVRAAGDSCRVFGSMGPTGKMLMMGDISEDELSDVFTQQADALKSGGVHGLVIETMADIEEAVIAVRAAKATGLPVAAGMVYDSGEEHDRTMMGVSPEQAAEALSAAGADILAANCGQGPDGYIPVAGRLHAASGLPVWIKPNAGLPQIVDGRAVYTMTPATFADRIHAILEAGASFVGGCCGTSPAYIRELAERKSRGEL